MLSRYIIIHYSKILAIMCSVASEAIGIQIVETNLLVSLFSTVTPYVLGQFVIITFTPLRAKVIGLSKTQGALLVSLMGAVR